MRLSLWSLDSSKVLENRELRDQRVMQMISVYIYTDFMWTVTYVKERWVKRHFLINP